MEREAGFEPASRPEKVVLFSIELFPLDYFLKGDAKPKGFQGLVLFRLVKYGGHDQATFRLSWVQVFKRKTYFCLIRSDQAAKMKSNTYANQ